MKRLQSSLPPFLFCLLMLALWGIAIGASLNSPLSIAQEGSTSLTETPAATALPPDVTPTAIPKPLPAIVLTQDGVTVELYFETLKQGRAGIVRVFGEGVIGARANLSERVTEFFAAGDEGFYGFVAVGMEKPARDYDLAIYAILQDESRVEFLTRLTVELGGFIKQTLDIPPERAYLIDPEVERTEFARLNAIFQNITSDVMWDSGEVDWQVPVNEAITSPFGAVRVLNGTVETRHTGWDMQTTTGTPVMASAAAKVAFAGALDIRGNVVILDHGYGVFSTYAHLSVMNVIRGQNISKGQVLGMSGNTGRSSGPHLHWEVNVNGEWVDSVDFLLMWIPG